MIPGKGVTIVLNGKTPLTAKESHPNFKKIVQAIKDKNVDAIPGLVNIVSDIATKSQGKLIADVGRGSFIFNGVRVHDYVTDHIKRSYMEGFDVAPMLAFLENCLLNPNPDAVSDLYKFLEAGFLPVTEDGHFIAYKKVRQDYKSVHDGRTDNSIGSKPSLPRAQCNSNRNETCSTGLHFCSQKYLGNFGGDRIVIVKVNPADVTAIPSDYNDTKGRACTYEIIGELDNDQKETAMTKNVLSEAVYSNPAVKTVPKVVQKKPVPAAKLPIPAKKSPAAKSVQSPSDAWPFPTGAKEQKKADATKPWPFPTAATKKPDTSSWPTALPVYSDAFCNGYKRGYADGKDKALSLSNANRSADYKKGYTQGIKDGRGHKAKLIK